VSGPQPGSVHDLTAARIWGILRELAAAGLITLADKGYIGAGQHVLVPYRSRGKPPSQKAANSAHAKLRAPGGRANAQLQAAPGGNLYVNASVSDRGTDADGPVVPAGQHHGYHGLNQAAVLTQPRDLGHAGIVHPRAPSCAWTR
jgi:hypothetical protein